MLSANSQELTDSICYNKAEAKAISIALIKGRECFKNSKVDSLAIIKLKANIEDYKENEADFQQTIVFKDGIIEDKKTQITLKDNELSKERSKSKWLKTGWLTSVVALVVLIIIK